MSDFQNFVTPHCHPGSLDTASTVSAFVEREKALGTGAITCTDHGTLGTAPQVYKLARKAKLTPILGLEGYFRDDDCPILRDAGIVKQRPPRPANSTDTDEKWNAEHPETVAHYQKYFHLTMHALDQEAYETLSRILSAADARAERHGSERKPLFTWAHLEELAAKNFTMSSSCLVGMVQRHLMAGKPELAIKYYEAVRKLVKPGNFFVEAFPHRCDKYWVKGVFISVANSDKLLRYWDGKKLRVAFPGEGTVECSAKELSARWEKLVAKAKGPVAASLLAVKNWSAWTDFEEVQEVTSVKAVEDYLQNECTIMAPDGDVQLAANRFMLWMAKKYGDPVLISDDSHFATPDEKVVQDIRLLAGGQDSWRFYGSYHRQSSDEAYAYFKQYLGTKEAEFAQWVQNSRDWAKRFGWEWKPRRQLPTKFYPEDTLKHTMDLIRQVGRMDWSSKVRKERLAAEVKMLHQNGTIDLLPYFFLDQDVVSLYEANGQLTGTGRGSAAGLLLTYLLGITHVDPLKYGLSKERFLTESRIRSGKLPDIDQDLPSRDLLIDPSVSGKGWLYDRFPGHFAQISTDTMLRLKSSIKDVHRVLHGKVTPEIEILTKKMEVPPQGVTDHNFVFGYKGADGQFVKGSIETDAALKEYVAKYPKEWDIVQKCLGVTRQKSKHACAFVISNEPITNFLPTTRVGDDDIPVTMYTAPWVEEVGGLKMDFLVVNSLKDIQGAIKLIQKSHGYQPKDERINGLRVPGIRVVPKVQQDGRLELFDVWDLPEDPAVFQDMCSGKTETCFQFNTPAARQWLELFNPNGKGTLTSIEHISAFTALDRPGPLDASVEGDGVERNMLEEFAARAAGRKPIGNNAMLDEMLPETYGVITYQEQLQKVFKRVGQTSDEEADEFRIHVSKKKMEEVVKDREVFMPGAIKTFGSESEAERIWGQLFTFGQYGFNKSHAVCYALTGYVCAWLKHHYPTEWWTSVLQNADRNEIDNTFWEHCGSYIDPPDIRLSEDDFAIQNGRIRAPLRLLNGMGKAAHEELVELRPFTDVKDFCQKVFERRKSRGTVGTKKVTKKGVTQEVKVLKLGRSALNRTILAKLVVSGAMNSLFPPEAKSVDEKLALLAQVKAEVEGGKVKPVDPRFQALTPIQTFQLRKEVLPSYTEDLIYPYARDLLPPTEFRAERGYRVTWKMPRPFDDDEWCPVVHGKVAKKLLDTEVAPEGIAPRFKFGVVAYVSEVEWFWNNKACRIHFEVNGERFKSVKWPTKKEKDDNKSASIPTDLKGAIAIVTLARWSEDRSFSIDDIYIVQPALDLSAEKEESAG